MENLKIRVNSEAESKEAQELFFELGYVWQGRGEEYLKCELNGFYILARKNGEMSYCDVSEVEFNSKNSGYSFLDTITLQELRDMVNPMKEYLDPDNGYDFIKWTGFAHPPESFIEVPEGAEIYAVAGDGIETFWSDKYQWLDGKITRWIESEDKDYTFKEWQGDWDAIILWQREKESIIDKLVVDEVKHSHYKKDVSHLNVIDPYRIAELYDLHSCADHIAKKALCAGNRGHKDTLRDIQDIIDTAERWKQMIEEDNNEI